MQKIIIEQIQRLFPHLIKESDDKNNQEISDNLLRLFYSKDLENIQLAFDYLNSFKSGDSESKMIYKQSADKINGNINNKFKAEINGFKIFKGLLPQEIMIIKGDDNIKGYVDNVFPEDEDFNHSESVFLHSNESDFIAEVVDELKFSELAENNGIFDVLPLEPEWLVQEFDFEEFNYCLDILGFQIFDDIVKHIINDDNMHEAPIHKFYVDSDNCMPYTDVELAIYTLYGETARGYPNEYDGYEMSDDEAKIIVNKVKKTFNHWLNSLNNHQKLIFLIEYHFNPQWGGGLTFCVKN